MWYVIALTLLTGADESYAPVKIGRGLWKSPAGFVYRSDKLFTGNELRRQEAAAGFNVGPVPPRTADEIRLAYGQRQPNSARYSFETPLDSMRRKVTESQDTVARPCAARQLWTVGSSAASSSGMRETGEVPAQGPQRESAERQTSQTANVGAGLVREDVPSTQPLVAESETTVSAKERMLRSELTASVSALDVQNTAGTGTVWQAKVVFESSERGCTSSLVGALVCVVVLGVALALLARDHIHRLHGQIV